MCKHLILSEPLMQMMELIYYDADITLHQKDHFHQRFRQSKNFMQIFYHGGHVEKIIKIKGLLYFSKRIVMVFSTNSYRIKTI